jgi:predicted PurR-regulated permease PerM
MDKRMFRSLLLLILFAGLVVFIVVKFDAILALLGTLITIFNPLFIGFALAFILNRPNTFFIKVYGKLLSRTKAKKLVEVLAVCTTYVILFICIGVVISFVIPQLTNSVSLLVNNAATYLNGLQNFVQDAAQRLHLKSLDLSKVDSIYNSFITGLKDVVLNALPNILNYATSVVSFFFTIIISFIISIYMLYGKKTLLRQVKNLTLAYLPRKVTARISDITALTADTFHKYVAGQLFSSVILGVLCFIGMMIFGFSYSVLISIIITVTALIPVLGSYIGSILSFLLLLMVSPTSALWFLLYIVVLQQAVGSIIYPRIVGGSIGLPGIWVLLAVTVGGSIFGFPGMILGVPVASILYSLLRRSVGDRLGKKETDAE